MKKILKIIKKLIKKPYKMKLFIYKKKGIDGNIFRGIIKSEKKFVKLKNNNIRFSGSDLTYSIQELEEIIRCHKERLLWKISKKKNSITNI